MTQKQAIELSPEKENDWKKAFEYPGMAPELWAAKYGHNLFCGDLRQYAFPDKTFQTWVHRVFEVLYTPGLHEEFREKLLSEEERKTIQREIEEES